MNTRDKANIGELEVGTEGGKFKMQSATVGAMTAKNPETDAEAGYITVEINGTTYEIPVYAIA